MSHSLYISNVKKIKKKLPELINIDKNPLDYYEVDAENAADWEKTIGQKVVLEYRSIDIFKAIEDICGKRPCSLSYAASCDRWNDRWDKGDDGRYCRAYFPDGTDCWITIGQLKPYYYTAHRTAYVYDKQDVAHIDSSYLVQTDGYRGRPLSKKEILEIVTKYMEENGNEDSDCSYYTQPVFELMKAYVAAGKRGSAIIFEVC